MKYRQYIVRIVMAAVIRINIHLVLIWKKKRLIVSVAHAVDKDIFHNFAKSLAKNSTQSMMGNEVITVAVLCKCSRLTETNDPHLSHFSFPCFLQ